MLGWFLFSGYGQTDKQRHGFGIIKWKHVGTQKISTQNSKLGVSCRSLSTNAPRNPCKVVYCRVDFMNNFVNLNFIKHALRSWFSNVTRTITPCIPRNKRQRLTMRRTDLCCRGRKWRGARGRCGSPATASSTPAPRCGRPWRWPRCRGRWGGRGRTSETRRTRPAAGGRVGKCCWLLRAALPPHT